MPAPTFVASYATVYNTSTAPKTVSVTTQAGDLLVIVSAVENGSTTFNTPSGNGIAFTSRQIVDLDTNWCDIGIWTGTDATGGTNWTLTVDTTAGGFQFGATCFVFRNHGGYGASSKTNVSGAAPSLGLTTTQDNSAIVVISADWVPVDGASRTWLTVNSLTPTNGNGMERTYHSNANYTAYAAYYSDAGTTGSKTVGLSAPGGQKYSIAAIEVKGTAGSGVAAAGFMWVAGVNS